MDPRALRIRLGLTQEQMARACNVSVSTIRAWEQGIRSPSGAAVRMLQLLDQRAPRRNTGLPEGPPSAEDREDAAAEARYLKRRGRLPQWTLADFLREFEES